MWLIYFKNPGIYKHKFQASGYIWRDKKIGGNNEALTKNIKGDSSDLYLLNLEVGMHILLNPGSLCFTCISYISFCAYLIANKIS